MHSFIEVKDTYLHISTSLLNCRSADNTQSFHFGIITTTKFFRSLFKYGALFYRNNMPSLLPYHCHSRHHHIMQRPRGRDRQKSRIKLKLQKISYAKLVTLKTVFCIACRKAKFALKWNEISEKWF